MVSVIGTDLANFVNIVNSDASNLMDSTFRIRGIGDTTYGNAIIKTPLTLGFREDANRTITVHFCALESATYKLVLGMDVLA